MVSVGWWLMFGSLILMVDLSCSSGISSFGLDSRRISRDFIVEECMVVTITSTTFVGGSTLGGMMIGTEAIKT